MKLMAYSYGKMVGILLNNSVDKKDGTWGVVSAPVFLLIS